MYSVFFKYYLHSTKHMSVVCSLVVYWIFELQSYTFQACGQIRVEIGRGNIEETTVVERSQWVVLTWHCARQSLHRKSHRAKWIKPIESLSIMVFQVTMNLLWRARVIIAMTHYIKIFCAFPILLQQEFWCFGMTYFWWVNKLLPLLKRRKRVAMNVI